MKRPLSTKLELVQKRIIKTINLDGQVLPSLKHCKKLIKQFHADIATYGSQTCLILCTFILTHFPRELRDIIWLHLSLPFIHKHIWNARYLGATCFREASETYFRNKTFRIGAQFLFDDFTARNAPYWYRNNLRTFKSPLSAVDLGRLITSVEFTINAYAACGKQVKYGPDRAVVKQLRGLCVFAPGTRVAIHIKNIVDEVFDALAWHRGENIKIDIFNCEDAHLRTFLRKLEKGLFTAFGELRDGNYRVVFVLESVIEMPVGVELAVEAWFGEIKKYHESLPEPVRKCRMADRYKN